MIIFVTGLPKSGTTYLANILSELNGFTTYYEGNWFKSSDEKYPGFWELLNPFQHWFRRQVYIMGGWVIRNEGNKQISEKEVKEHFGEFCKQILRREFFNLSHYKNIIDKTPLEKRQDILNMQYVFPEAKILIMKRNFPDWLISYLFFFIKLFDKEGRSTSPVLYEKDYYHFKLWEKKKTKYPLCTGAGIALLKLYNDFYSIENALIIPYEELYTEPIKTIDSLLKTLNLYGNVELLCERGKKGKNLMKDFRRSGEIGDYKNCIDNDFLKEINYEINRI